MLSLFLIFIITIFIYCWFTLKPQNYPPGPLCLPVIGSALFVKTYNFHLYLQEIKKYYGPVIGFKFGRNFMVGVTGSKEVKEVFMREEFQGRPSLSFVNPGIMFDEGESWTVQRKFTLRHLRDFGFGKKTTESVISEEAKDFFHTVLYKNKIIQISGLFTVSTVNVLWAMIGGKRYSHDNQELQYLLKCLQERFRSGNVTGGLSNVFPLLRKIFPFLFKTEIITENLLKNFLQRAISEHRKTKTEDARDFIDVYLTELDKSEIHWSFSEEKLVNICSDLFSAASESVGNSIGFCLLYCVLYPKWQKELYEEIEENREFTPLLLNRNKYPKVEAFIAEVTRCNTVASLAVPHKAVRDTHLNGYFIPKGTMLLVSIWSILQDEEHWKDPQNFRPERFLDGNGNFRRENEWLPAFGMGKRICPGETLAKDIIFVYFIALIREFVFEIPEGRPKPSTVCLSGFTNAPRPFEVKITKR